MPRKPLVEILISKENLLSNLNTYKQKYKNHLFAPVLKSNAYGHGLLEVARIFDDDESVPFLSVDSYYEARILRDEGVKKHILIIGYTFPEIIKRNGLKKISFVITDLEQLEEVALGLKRPANIHIKFDIGMHRQGILPEDFEKAINLGKKNQNLNIEGICSHLSDADGESEDFTINQIREWNKIVEKSKKTFDSIKYFHISATKGVKFLNKRDYAVISNCVRLGIGLLGIEDGEGLGLTPAMRMETVLSGIKKIRKGDKVGYNVTFEAPSDMTIATIPAGYYEGIDRRLSNKGIVKVGNTWCPIIGRVSMNISSIDVSKVPAPQICDKDFFFKI